MMRILLKKQLTEVFAWIFYNSKTGKTRSKLGVTAFALLFVFVFAMLGVMFSEMAKALCVPLAQIGLTWLYFAIMGLVATALGVIGSVFSTYSSMYLAKDNDLLLSMPVPPSKILFARLVGVYFIGLMYELTVMIPTLIVYYIYAAVTPLAVLFSAVIPLILSLFVLTLSCALGWLVALISSKLKRKNIITVILSITFIVGYYYIYGNAYSMLQKLLANPFGIGNKVKGVLYPFYQMGLGAEGKAIPMLIFTAIVAVLFALLYLILSKSFIGIATANKGTVKIKYREKGHKVRSVNTALLQKELRRFAGSANYMLNCGLGIVLMPAAAVFLFVRGQQLLAQLSVIPVITDGLVSLVAVAAVCMMSSMNDMSAPSVSLEGKNIWVIQSLPVTGRQVLLAKLKMHLLLTVIPASVLMISVIFAVRPVWYYAVMTVITPVSFIVLTALFGLALDTKNPNLNWTNEAVPVKQSLTVTLSILGGWGVIGVLGTIYFFVSKYISPLLYLVIVTVIFTLVSFVLLKWLVTKGSKRFETL